MDHTTLGQTGVQDHSVQRVQLPERHGTDSEATLRPGHT